MISSKITFTNQQGLELAAVLDRPVDEQPLAYAVFAHCFTCSKDLRAVKHISRSLTVAGYAVLRFDFTGLGNSEGEFAESGFTTNQGDLESACAWLEDRFEAPALMIGHSLGGTAVLHTAAGMPSVKAVATIGSPFDPAHVAHLFADRSEEIENKGEANVTIAGRSFKITQSFIDDLERTDCTALIGSLDAALMVMHSPIDTIVGIDNAAAIFKAARHPKSFVSLDTADHLLSDEADARYVGSLLGSWARRYLDVPQELAKGKEEGSQVVSVRTGREKYYTEIIANGHALVADEPADLGGTNLGPTPFNLMLSGLGACTAITVRMYADRKGWPLEDIHVDLVHYDVDAEDCKDCGLPEGAKGKVIILDRKVRLFGDELTEDMKKRIMIIADKCPVHKAIVGQTVIKTELVSA